MPIKQLGVAALLASVSWQIAAQTNKPTEKTSTQTVSGSYESAFTNYRSYKDTDRTPDQVWRALNDEVGKTGGMGHMAGHTMSAPETQGAPASDKAAGKVAPVKKEEPKHVH